MKLQNSPVRPPIRSRADQLAHQGKELHDRGYKLPFAAESRLFFCRNCGEQQNSAVVPDGWYSLSRHIVRMGRPSVARLGLFCCLECLLEQFPRLDGVSRTLADNWAEITKRYRG